MARTVKDTNLESRTARSRLPLSNSKTREPYWRTIDQGAHIGYFKGTRGGTWIARLYLAGKYRKTKLGTADDVRDADGVTVLDFKQAQGAARAWFTLESRKVAGLSPEKAGPYSIIDVMTDYLSWFESRRKSYVNTKAASDRNIIPALGTIEASKLTTVQIREWHEGLAKATKGSRQSKLFGQNVTKAEARATKQSIDFDAVRKRRATANRILTVLKAALNHAWREGLITSDEAWRRVKPFHGVDMPVVRYLSIAESLRLVNAAEPSFRPLIRTALLTGARYGEIRSLRASDYNADAGTLTIRESKGGKSRHVVLTDEGQRSMLEVTFGLSPDQLIFTRAGGAAWKSSDQQRPLLEACKHAKIVPAVSFHILRHTYGSLLASKGVPLGVIASQLGHADTRMTERHYAHLAPSYVATTIRESFPDLGIAPKTNVRPLQHPKAT